jgi:hypothetical protein
MTSDGSHYEYHGFTIDRDAVVEHVLQMKFWGPILDEKTWQIQ